MRLLQKIISKIREGMLREILQKQNGFTVIPSAINGRLFFMCLWEFSGRSWDWRQV